MGPPIPAALLSQLRFDTLAALPERRIGLAEGALLIAEIADPEIDHSRHLRVLDGLAAAVRVESGAVRRIGGVGPPTDRATAERGLAALREVLALREGFRGDEDGLL